MNECYCIATVTMESPVTNGVKAVDVLLTLAVTKKDGRGQGEELFSAPSYHPTSDIDPPTVRSSRLVRMV